MKNQINKRQMKTIAQWALIAMIFIVSSCKQPTETVEPTTAAEVRTALKEKKAEFANLQNEIKELTDQLEKLDPKEIKPIPVESQSIVPARFESFTTVQGSIVAEELASATSETGGRITTLNVSEGQYVTKGQLIAIVDLETLEKQRMEMETALSLARTVYERQSRLWQQNIGSELQYLEAKNNVERLEQSLNTMGSQISKKNVYAPIAGVVDNVLLKQGELATPGYPIVQILDTGALKIKADLPETFLASVKRGSKVEVYFPALDYTLNRTISDIGRKIDPSNRTFAIEMNTSSQGGKLKPNLLAEVKVRERSKEEVIAIPINLLQQEVSGDNFVYVVGNDGTASKRYISTGEANDDKIIITEGLNGGDELIMRGAIGLAEGTPLKVSPFVKNDESTLN